MRKLQPRETRLLIIAIFLACIVPFAPRINPQLRHLRQVEHHISLIRPQWESFKNQHPGFELARFFPYTGGDGLFGAYGYVPSEQHLAKLRTFMESTKPPRPVYLKGVLVVGEDEFENLKNRKITEANNRTKRR